MLLLATVLLRSRLVTVLGQASMMLLLVSSMSFLVSLVTVGGSVLVLNLGEVLIDAVDLGTAVNESHLAIGLVDETIKLIGLLHASLLDFLLLFSLQFGLESSILLLLLLDLAACSLLIIRLLNKLMVVCVMLLGVLVTVLHLSVQVNTADFGTALDEVLLAICMVNVAIELVGSGSALLVLLLKLLLVCGLCLGVLLLLSLGLLSLEGCLSLGLFLLLAHWLLLVHDVSHAVRSVSVMLMASVLGQSLRRVESTLGEVFRGHLALRMILIVSSISSLVGGHDGVSGMVRWLSLLVVR